MTNIEAATIIRDMTDKDLIRAIAFFEGDCGIKPIMAKKIPNQHGFLLYLTAVYTTTIGEFYYNQAFEFTQKLLEKIPSGNRDKVIAVIQSIADSNLAKQKAVAVAQAQANPHINVSPTITNQASANAQNTMDIKNLSELSAYISNSTTITNKAEIQNALSALEDAKDNGSADSYVGLLIRLVGLLCKDGILPPFVGKLVGGLGKWF